MSRIGSRLCLILLLFLAVQPALAADKDAAVLTVATRHVPPFAIKEPDGSWSGISIELWRRIAKQVGLEFDLREMGLKEMLDAVERGEVAAAVAALTITSDREGRMDFSHPFLSTGLAIATSRASRTGWLAVTQRFLSPAFLKVVGTLFGLLLLVGVIVWLFERRRNQQFGGSLAKGIGSGLWWSAVTMTTVGYGDKAPHTLGGRTVAMVWMFASVIVISSFTASIATALTVGALGGKVRSQDDLPRARVTTLADSTSALYLEGRRIDFQAAANLNAALAAVVEDRADAIVYDEPVLRYLVRQQFRDMLSVLPGSFERQDYGIALPAGSPHREAVNRVLLKELRGEDWKELLYRYLGQSA